jgi:hypothetical protein
LSDIKTHPFGNRRFLAAAVLGFTLLSLVLFTDALNSSFLSDDFVILKAVEDNGAFGIWSGPKADFFRPWMSIYFFVTYRIWSANPFPFHLAGVVAHALNSLLVCMIAFLLLREMPYRESLRRVAAVAAGILFLALPSHSEPVSWIAAGIDVFAALFALGSVFTYIWHRSCPHKSVFTLSLVLFALSLLSKEAAVALPLVLLAYEVYLKISRRGRPREPFGNLLSALPHFGIALVYFVLRRISLGTFIGGYGSPVHLNVSPFRLALGLARLPARTFLPPLPTRLMGIGALGVLTVAAITAVAVIHFRRKRRLPGAIILILVCYFVLMLPVVNLSVHLVDIEGERLVYLPSALGVILLLALLLYVAPDLKRLAAICACLLAAFAFSLAGSNSNWRRASDIAESVIASLEAFPHGSRIFILNLPDSIRGAYIFRNGLNEAAALSGLAGDMELITVSRLKMVRADDTVSVEETDGLYRVRVTNPATRLSYRALSPGGKLNTEQFDVLSLGPDSYEVRFREIGGGDIIALLSDGELVRHE